LKYINSNVKKEDRKINEKYIFTHSFKKNRRITLMIKDNPLILVKKSQSDFFKNGKTLDIKTRIRLLIALKQSVKAHESDITLALKKDLGKPTAEIWLAEIYIVLDELNTVIKNLQFWAKPRRVKGKWLNTPSKDWIVPEPYGVTLHIAPWNYPFQLALNPLIGAVAAGNTVVLKPSEHAPQTAAVIEKIISKVFPKEWVACSARAVPETAAAFITIPLGLYLFYRRRSRWQARCQSCSRIPYPHYT
jgi:aldehyde dehydrogenase (NAD+)